MKPKWRVGMASAKVAPEEGVDRKRENDRYIAIVRDLLGAGLDHLLVQPPLDATMDKAFQEVKGMFMSCLRGGHPPGGRLEKMRWSWFELCETFGWPDPDRCGDIAGHLGKLRKALVTPEPDRAEAQEAWVQLQRSQALLALNHWCIETDPSFTGTKAGFVYLAFCRGIKLLMEEDGVQPRLATDELKTRLLTDEVKARHRVNSNNWEQKREELAHIEFLKVGGTERTARERIPEHDNGPTHRAAVMFGADIAVGGDGTGTGRPEERGATADAVERWVRCRDMRWSPRCAPWIVPDVEKAEKAAHRALDAFRLQGTKELYVVSFETARLAVGKAIGEHRQEYLRWVGRARQAPWIATASAPCRTE